MARTPISGGILDVISSRFGRPDVVSDRYGLASSMGDDFSSHEIEGDAYVPPTLTEEEAGPNPGQEDAARQRDSSSFGGDEESKPSYNFKGDIAKLLAGALASYGVGKLAGDFDTTEALAAFGRGYLKKKDSDMTRKMDEKHEQGKFMVQGALRELDDLQSKWDPAKLQRAGIPQSILDRYAQLQQKISEARISDDVVTPKEAQELIAFAAPIRSALNEADTTMASPEFKAKETEAGEYAGLRSAVDRLMSGGRSFTDTTSVTPEGEESDVYSDPEQATNALYERLLRRTIPDERGYLAPERASLERAQTTQAGMDARQTQRHQHSLELLAERVRLYPPRNSREKSVFDRARELLSTTSKFADSPEQALEKATELAQQEIDAGRTAPPSAADAVIEKLPPVPQRIKGKVYRLNNGALGRWNGRAFEPVNLE